MIKKEIYPKTKRVSCHKNFVEITEKLDGANLCIFKLNGEVAIAQRKTIIFWHELVEQKQLLYKGLFNWLTVNEEYLNKLNEGSVLCGEWLGMGVLKYYPDDGFNKRFYMFAKANIDEELNLYNIYYDHELFIYPFEGQQIPDCIGIVPVVDRLDHVPTKEELDEIYDRYMKSVERNVEGFVINYENTIKKYVRMKSGKLQEHFDRG